VRDKPKSSLKLLQSLRAIAALMVLAVHLYLQRDPTVLHARIFPSCMIAGEAGVDLFFVISGFIMMHITPAAHRCWVDQGIFLFRRAARIYPTYWVVALPLLALWLWRPELINHYSGHRADVVATILLCPSRIPTVLIVSWTLVLEISYYIVASFIFYAAGNRRLELIFLWLVGLLAGSLFLPVWAFANPWINCYFSSFTPEFIGGMLLAHFLGKGVRPVPSRLAALLVLAAFAEIIAWGTWHGTYVGVNDHTRIICYGLPTLLIAGLVIEADLRGQWAWLARLAPLGDRSYALYLVHFPIIAAICGTAGRILPPSPILHLVVELPAVAVMLVLAVEIIHRFVEKPSHSWSRRVAATVLREKISSPSK
jgi:peptidoglycan/LPS O-acetylase OafA/YrhL